MKRILKCVGWVIGVSGVLQASGIVSCNPNPNATSNACSASYLNTFETVQWNTLYATNPSDPVNFSTGLTYNTTSAPWDTSLAGVNIQVTGQDARVAVNYADMPEVYNSQTYWVPSSSVANSPYSFTGQFNSQPDAGSGSPGDYLVGSAQPSGGGSAAPLVISANQPLTMFGFRISAVTMTSFQLTVDLFTSANGAGAPAEILTYNLTNGGNCSGLISSSPTTAPTPCNNAPFVAINPTGQYRSFSVSTSDPTGFYLDGFDLELPEPGAMLLSGAGLIGLAYLIRRKRVNAAAARS